MTTEATEQSANGAAPPDLMKGWSWMELLLPAIREQLPPDKAEEMIERIAKELEPLSHALDDTLAKRSHGASIDDRVETLERKVFMLRQVNELLLGLAITRVEKLYELLREGAIDRALTAPRAPRRPQFDEEAQRLARRLRMLGQ